MSNLEDVFLKINQEFAPDLFGDLKGFGARRNSSINRSSLKDATSATSIGHSTEVDVSQKLLTQSDSSLSKGHSSADSSGSDNNYEIDENDGQNLIRGSSCVRSCSASSAKRVMIYKRDWCGLLCQIVIPVTLVLFGLWLQSGPIKIQQSPPRIMSTGFYPDKQRLLINKNPVLMANDGFDVSGEELFAALPNSTSAFEATYTGNLTYNDFYNAVYEARNELPLFPYRYGSY